MLIAVLSDVHSNLEALEAVLARASEAGATSTLVLGDLVGYGADPHAVLDRLAALPSAHLLAGNHDLAAVGRFDTAWFNPVAAAAIKWTMDVLPGPDLELLARLAPRGEDAGAVLVHGSVVEPATEYVISSDVARKSFDAEPFRLCFFGHTHLPTVFERADDGAVRRTPLEGEATVSLDGSSRFMLNPGSVGQPRDGDSRASFMLFDAGARTATVQRVPYDLERAQAKIRAAGLPEPLADRLAVGR